VQFPLNVLCVVSGVSGSGKDDAGEAGILYPALQKLKGEFGDKVGCIKRYRRYRHITQVELVDQNPIGKSSRSNPVTYIKAYERHIRDLYAAAAGKIRGFQAKAFFF
jgi:excinuclease ABC subunit A